MGGVGWAVIVTLTVKVFNLTYLDEKCQFILFRFCFLHSGVAGHVIP